MKKLILLYLSTRYTKQSNLKNFITNYRKFKPGIKHELIICFKNLNFDELKKRKNILKKIKYREFVDPSNKNDHEWGSIGRVSEEFNPSVIFYMNDYSYPIKENCLGV